MRSSTLRLKQSVKHIATAAVVLATLIHATTNPVRADSKIGKRPNSAGFSFDLNDTAELKDGRFQGAVQNSFFVYDPPSSGNNFENCPPFLASLGSNLQCISLKSGDLTPSTSSDSIVSNFFNSFGPGSTTRFASLLSPSTYIGGTTYTTTLYPTDLNSALRLSDRDLAFESLSVEILLPFSSQDFTQRLPSFLDFQQAFSADDQILVGFVGNVSDKAFAAAATTDSGGISVRTITNVSSEAEPVPEPIEGTVLGAGVMGAGLLLLKRRKAKQQSIKL